MTITLSQRDVGKLFARKLGRPMTYLGVVEEKHLFIFRDPPQDYLAFRPDQLWMLERVRPEAAPVDGLPNPLTKVEG
ncbi:hypothetical protein [Burkholderia multivorans]|uniref:hypothetical protein n=1 Tax=Burkholderia multivorans TaxID=87883 RepID=UPI0021C094C6|nr:hypothetical protein [Burkholderia multivorans]MDR9177931.1 hypothetical protein [Burkholderia multivorans]MDR9183983.1 hypothetical protein [Burkholderia multivorans]MDR9187455.1 hypothetical protein [Burkholderia multivorans]MDR9195191.1 hypothetical protein [Burkholderia multivorans]MDR9200887.1 hypothetical protein [Burkholderia multivorans]